MKVDVSFDVPAPSGKWNQRALPDAFTLSPAWARSISRSAASAGGGDLESSASTRLGSRWVSSGNGLAAIRAGHSRSEEHTAEIQSLMRISYDVFCLNTKTKKLNTNYMTT